MISFNKKNIFFTLIIIAGSLLITKCALQAETAPTTSAEKSSSATEEVATSSKATTDCYPLIKNVDTFRGKIVNARFSNEPTAMLKITFKEPDLSNQNLRLNTVPAASIKLNFMGSAKDLDNVNPPFDVYYNNPNIYLSSVRSESPDNDHPVYLSSTQRYQEDVSVCGTYSDNGYCQFVWSFGGYSEENPNEMYVFLYYWHDDCNTPNSAEVNGTLFFEIIGRDIVSVNCVNTPIDELSSTNEAQWICCENCLP